MKTEQKIVAAAALSGILLTAYLNAGMIVYVLYHLFTGAQP